MRRADLDSWPFSMTIFPRSGTVDASLSSSSPGASSYMTSPAPGGTSPDVELLLTAMAPFQYRVAKASPSSG